MSGRHVEPYARWTRISQRATDDDASVRFAIANLEAELIDYCRNNFLTIEDTPIGRFVTEIFGDAAGDDAAIVECHAAGLRPEKRLPQGWRAFFCAP